MSEGEEKLRKDVTKLINLLKSLRVDERFIHLSAHVLYDVALHPSYYMTDKEVDAIAYYVAFAHGEVPMHLNVISILQKMKQRKEVIGYFTWQQLGALNYAIRYSLHYMEMDIHTKVN